MHNKDSRETTFKEFFRSAKTIAGVLGGSADHHYGFSYTMPEPIDVKKFMQDVKEGRIKFDTTEQERAERAKVPFTKFCSTFNSLEEVTEVCKLLEERHGEENPDEGEAEKLIPDLLAEVRASLKG